MTTFADVQKHAEGVVLTFMGKDTPVGHWEATTKIMSNLVTYLLEGEKDSLEAVVKGSVVLVEKHGNLAAIGYSGGSLIGGNSMGFVPNFKAAFAGMV
jgi:hypothetical protein